MFVTDIPHISIIHSYHSVFVYIYFSIYAAQRSVLKFETECQGLCVNRKLRYFGCNIFRTNFVQNFSTNFGQNFKNFGENLNKIFNKIPANLNILPKIIAEVLLLL